MASKPGRKNRAGKAIKANNACKTDRARGMQEKKQENSYAHTHTRDTHNSLHPIEHKIKKQQQQQQLQHQSTMINTNSIKYNKSSKIKNITHNLKRYGIVTFCCADFMRNDSVTFRNIEKHQYF